MMALKAQFWMLMIVILIMMLGTVIASSVHIQEPILTDKAFTAADPPPTECPLSEKDRDKHTALMFSFQQTTCPHGTFYFCEKVSGYLVENCFNANICPKGTTNYVEFDPMSRNATLNCRKCEKHFYQAFDHDTKDEFYPGCQEPSITLEMYNQLDNMVIVSDGHGVDVDKYVCNTSKGYSDLNKNVICDSTRLCNCDTKRTCEDMMFPVLLPNGECDKPCAIERVNYYTCNQYEPLTQTTPSKAAYLSSPLVHPSTDHPIQNNGADGTTDSPRSSSDSNVPTATIVGVVIGVIVVVPIIIAAVVFYKKRKRVKDAERGQDTGKQI